MSKPWLLQTTQDRKRASLKKVAVNPIMNCVFFCETKIQRGNAQGMKGSYCRGKTEVYAEKR